MSEDISITNEEYKQLINFHNKKIDHVYILPFNESNPQWFVNVKTNWM